MYNSVTYSLGVTNSYPWTYDLTDRREFMLGAVNLADSPWLVRLSVLEENYHRHSPKAV